MIASVGGVDPGYQRPGVGSSAVSIASFLWTAGWVMVRCGDEFDADG
jgi:hypothetical protein